MDYWQVHGALREVRNLKRSILDKQRFKGYSGRARAIGGCLALAMVPLLYALPWRPLPDILVFAGWGLVFVGALTVNSAALLQWYWTGRKTASASLKPALETLPVWIAGGAITLALWRNGEFDLLYGIWMSLYGIAQGISRHVLPRAVLWVGAYYLVCGFACLLWAEGIFSRPWVMGAVFFAGEFASGIIFHYGNCGRGVADFFGVSGARHLDDE